MDVSEGARLRVVVYRRVSDTKQEKDGDSLSTQQQDCFAWVRERDGVLVADLADVHTGRELEDRPTMAEARKLIRARKCDVVLVRKFDRLDRSHEIRAVLRYEARRFGVQYASVVEGMVDETPNGRLNDFIRAFIGEGELDNITERAVRGMRNRADKGLPLVGPRPLYGYRWVDPKRGVYEPDPTTARVVAVVFTLLADGGSLHSVVRALDERRIPTPFGKLGWNRDTLRKMVANGRYWGEGLNYRHAYSREYRYDASGEPRKVTVKTFTGVERGTPITEGLIPPIVSRDLAERALAQVRANDTGRGRNSARPDAFLLRGGFIRCGSCGTRLVATFRAVSAGNHNPLYRCPNAGGCPKPSISVSRIDGPAWAAVEAHLGDMSVCDRRLAALRASYGEEQEEKAAALDAELVDITGQREGMAWAVAQAGANTPTATSLLGVMAALDQKETRLRAARDEAAGHVIEWQRVQAHVAMLHTWAEEGRRRAFTYAEKRFILWLLGVQVRLHPKEAEQRATIRIDPFDEPDTSYLPLAGVGLADRTAE